MGRWFDDVGVEGEGHREVLGRLEERAVGWVAFGVEPEHAYVFEVEGVLVVGLDVDDPEERSVLRTLRADFRSDAVTVGVDPTGQYVGMLGDALSGSAVVTSERSSGALLADAAADWFERELARPIERHEWDGHGFRHRRWQLADTGELLCWSDSANLPRDELGPPDRIVAIRKFEASP